MQELKKQLEILLVNYFRNVYSEFPKGSIRSSESPDFIFRLKNRHRLGIELVRLNPAGALPFLVNEENTLSLHDELINDIRELFEQSSDVKLFMKFRFSEERPITQERSLPVAVKTNVVLRNFLKNKKAESFFYHIFLKNVLPDGIDEVLLVHHPALETSVWERSNNLGISSDLIGDIHKAIEKKEEKLILYQKQHLDAYWLLITTDCLRGLKNYNIQNQLEKQNYRSGFEHVFLFDLLHAKINQLV
jgi:hypothetical protein